jgi:hypothetical protein
MELSQVQSLADIPIPSPVQKLIDRAQNLKAPNQEGDGSSPTSRGASYDIYASLPRSLKKEVMVRTKVEEDEGELKRRQNLVETKTPAELSQIHSLAEVPLPRRVEAWLHHNEQESSSRNRQEMKELIYKTILPESITKPCVVRSRIEDPEVLVQRQELQQNKSIHELSKIRNLNEFPLPLKFKLPDVPLPSAKDILKAIAPMSKNGKGGKQNADPYVGEYTPASTPQTGDLMTDDEMLRYETSTPGGDTTHRDQDFGYEVVDHHSTSAPPQQQHLQQIPSHFRDDIIDHQGGTIAEVEKEEDSLAEQYKGTPPLKSKKKKHDRRSHEIPENVQLGDEIPPPLPPKRPSSMRRELRESPVATTAGQLTKARTQRVSLQEYSSRINDKTLCRSKQN